VKILIRSSEHVDRTYKLSVDPVELPVTIPATVCQHVSEELTQVVVVWSFKEVQSTDVVQILAQLVYHQTSTTADGTGLTPSMMT